MSENYRFDHKPRTKRKRHMLLVTLISLVAVGVISASIVAIVHKTTKTNNPSVGPTKIVGQVEPADAQGPYNKITEPDFTISLPGGWAHINDRNAPQQTGLTWEYIQPPDTARYLAIYVDSSIPATYAINRLLPVTSNGPELTYGQLSDSCENFSPGDLTKPILSKWQDINFYCNLPDRIDDQIGTGSSGGINTVSVTGPKDGSHQYFFIYTDRSGEPDYSIFYSILTSFRAT
jgi:hypothetical protein